MKISAESYLKGPVSSSSITEVLCYSSKATGLVIDRINLSEVSEKVLNLGIEVNKNYVPVKLVGQTIEIKPSRDLAYSPSSGFDTLIYYVKLDEHRDRFPIGYSKLLQTIGQSTLTAVESIHYDRIRINLDELKDLTEYEAILAEIGEREVSISDPQRNYLKDFKTRGELDYSGIHVEAPIHPTNSVYLNVFPINNIENTKIATSNDSSYNYWEFNKKAPVWIGADGVRVLRRDPTTGINKYWNFSYTNNANRIIDIPELREMSAGDLVEDDEKKFRHYQLPRYISREFIIDENGGLWSYPYLSTKQWVYNRIREGKTLKYMGEVLETVETVNGEETNVLNYDIFPIPTYIRIQQPLLDIFSGTLVSHQSIFDNVISAQNRVRDIVNTIIPLTLLFMDDGKIWIKVKIGAWFVFDLPQYGIEIVQNRNMALAVPRENCQFYVVNDKTILIRTPRGLRIYNTPGEWCDQYIMDTAVSRFPHSKLLKRFTVGGELINEENIFESPLNRYRKGILPRGKINIVGALNGIIIYFQIINGKVQISYL